MRSRRSFTESEIETLRRLIARKEVANRGEQKQLRQQMRDMDFYISDFSRAASAFGVSDFDRLVAEGTIRVAGRGHARQPVVESTLPPPREPLGPDFSDPPSERKRGMTLVAG